MRTIHRVGLIVMLATCSTGALGVCPTLTPLFPAPHVTAQQLNDLLVRLRGRAGFSCRQFGPHQLSCGSDDSQELWWLTEVGHPAHPAVSRGQMLTDTDTQDTCLVRDGYFAGAEELFSQWFSELKRYDEKTIEAFKRQDNAT
jgi:hypothetical protein